MAGDKYLAIGADGEPTEVIAVQSSGGAGNAGDIVALGSDGLLNANMMPSGVGAEQIEITAAEALSQWDVVNVYLDGGTLKARKADGGTNKYVAHGYCPAAIESAATGNIQTEGLVTSSGMTPGKAQFLDVATPGARTETVPTGAGKINQKIGYALSATQYKFQAYQPITLAS